MATDLPDLTTLGAAAVAAGVALLVVGTLLLVLGGIAGSDAEGDVEAGGVVFVGPIPIVFGTGKGAVWLAVAIALLMLAAYAVVVR